jgi:hypothetical protein
MQKRARDSFVLNSVRSSTAVSLLQILCNTLLSAGDKFVANLLLAAGDSGSCAFS